MSPRWRRRAAFVLIGITLTGFGLGGPPGWPIFYLGTIRAVW